MGQESERLIQHTPIEEFFCRQVRRAIESQKVPASPHTEFYLVRLLSDFSSTQSLYPSEDQEETPLAILYLRSLHADRWQGIQLLKQLADFALYISGFFQDSLQIGKVDLDYYISMGGNAYHRLHSMNTPSGPCHAFSETFKDLGMNFTQYMDVLTEISESSSRQTDADLLKLYEKWLQSGSRRIQRKLHAAGIPTVQGRKKEILQ